MKIRARVWTMWFVAIAALGAGAAILLSAGSHQTVLALPNVKPVVALSTARRSPKPTISVGPGAVRTVIRAHHYSLQLQLSPNRVALADDVSLKLFRRGRPASGARVRLTFSMLDMNMDPLTGVLPERAPGTYTRPGPVLGMGGDWLVRVAIEPRRGARFSLAIVDHLR